MKKHLIILCLSCSGFLTSQNLLTGLKACYPLDCDGAVNQAATGSQYNATLFGPLVCTPGHLSVPNSAYQFTGNSALPIYNVGVLGTQVICISGWFYLNNFSANLIYHSAPCNGAVFSVHVIQTLNGPSIQFDRTANSCVSPVPFNLPTTAVSVGWHHVVFSLSSTEMKIWIDNAQYSLITPNYPIQQNLGGASIIIGGNPLGGMNWFNGAVDNLRFYDRQLTNAEITDLFQNDPTCASGGTPPPPPPTPGNYCSGSLNGLSADYQVGLNGFTYNFTTPSNTGGKVIIGRTTCASATARLMVGDDNIGNSIFGNSSTSGDNIGVKGAGIDMNVNPLATTFGILGEAHQSNNPTSLSAGVAGFCGGWNSNMMPHGQNIGVYGNSISNTGAWAGYFDGDVNINGNGWILAPWTFSDQRFKKDINKLENVTDKLKKLNGYSYNFRKGEYANKNFDEQKHIGLIAQEIKEVFPELVREGKDGFYGVDYQGMIPVLLEAFKNQQQQIEELKGMIQTIASTSSNSKKGINAITIELSDKNTIVLDQNVPNPFAESTTISYNIPDSFTKAQIVFSSNDGKLIKVLDITEKGEGSLIVFASDLTHGLYTYTLVIDGKTIATKTMIKE